MLKGRRPGQPNVDRAAMLHAYQAAMVPNPTERGKFLIPNDLDDGFQDLYDDSEKLLGFWAPVISPDRLAGGATVEDEINQMITALTAPPTSNPTLGAVFDQNFKDALKAGFIQYLNDLKQGAGEDTEGFNIVKMTDPLSSRPGSPVRDLFLSPDIMMNKPQDIKTSWADFKDGENAVKGRNGYSVKFVSFKTLRKKEKIFTDGSGASWDNDLSLDGQAESDVDLLQH